MSDLQIKAPARRRFLLGDIAPYLEKDQRTLRRWCQLGLVPGARRTRGGHWRIYGTDRVSVLRAIRGRVSFGAGDALVMDNGRQHKARRRRENAYPPGMVMLVPRERVTPRQAWLSLKPAQHKAIADMYAPRTKTDRARLLQGAIARLREQRDDNHDPYSGELTAMIERGNLQMLVEMGHAEIIADTLGRDDKWEKSPPPPRMTVDRLSQLLGISRRTFYRWFPGWRHIAFDGVVQDQSRAAVRAGEQVTDYDPDAHAQSVDAALGWKEPNRATTSA